MKDVSGWVNNGDEKCPKYDFVPPPQWAGERVTAEQNAMLKSLENDDAPPRKPWLQLAAKLPGELKRALLSEMRAGNQLVGISSVGWPNDGSIVVNLRDRFTAVRFSPVPGTTYRELNDPHYCREELSQKVGEIEFLILS